MNLPIENIFLALGIALITGLLALNVGINLYNFEKITSK
jgi:Photosystem I protein M (PsaM)